MKPAIGKPGVSRRSAKTGFQSIGLIASLLLALAVMVPSSLFAQGTTGSITGTVTDASNAAIPGATVTIQNLGTSYVRVVTTGDNGMYTVTSLLPGRYSVKVEKSAFKTYIRTDLTLQINQVLGIDIQLQVGGQNETVQVTTQAPVIQTEDSSVGQVIDSQSIQNTPLNGRLSIMGLMALAPGVQAPGAQDQMPVYGVTPTIGTGSRNAYGGMGDTLDGVTNQSVTLQRGEGEVPPFGAIAEFKMITTGAPAEFNQPAQLIIVTKSGTNEFHGELLEYNRSKGTGAKSYYGGSLPRPPYERNEYGGDFTGPIVIPHVYNGRNRSFFFTAYEGFHLTQSNNVNSAQPTAAERNGDFSAFSGQIINPATGLQFTNNQIPSSMFNPVTQQLLKILYPLPTQSGYGTNTYELVPYKSDATRFSLRLDHKISDKDQFRATFLRAFYGPNPSTGASSLQGGMSGIGEHNMNTILGWTHTFSPTLLLDVWASYLHLPVYRTPQNVKTDFSSIIPGLGAQLIEGAPQISITNITSVAEQGSHDLSQDIEGYAVLTKVTPRHTIKAGYAYVFDNHWNQGAVSPQRGSYTFNGHYTQGSQTNISGARWGVADFMLGYPSSTANAAPTTFITRNRSHQMGMYVQDDWKLTPALTVNAGIRYDLQLFLNNPYGLESLYIPSLKEVVVFGNSYPSASIPAFLTSIPIALSSSVAGFPQHVFDYVGHPKKNFAPRLGFAYQIKPNWVLRGAAGIYFNLLPGSYMITGFSTLPFQASSTFTNSTGTMPTFTMSNPFSATGKFAANPSVNSEHALVTPYTEEYNLAIEHEFRGGLGLRVGYVGQHNVKQNNNSGSGNTAPNINLANPPVVGVSSQTTNLVQPFATISLMNDPIFHSQMNSLQVGVHKQYSHGFTVNAEYQWTRVLGTENIQNPSGQALQDSFGNVGGVANDVLQVSYSYALPMGKGQALFGTASNVVDKLVGGWQLSGISAFQGGQPFSVSFSAAGSPVGLVSGRADLVPGVAIYPAKKTRSQWFNPSAFAVPKCYNSTGSFACSTWNSTMPTTYASYGNSAYNMLRGPHFQDWDMSLQKNIPWKEHYNMQLRVDSFNIFNHPNFAAPNANISNSNVATITGTSGSPSYAPRTIEFAAKFNF